LPQELERQTDVPSGGRLSFTADLWIELTGLINPVNAAGGQADRRDRRGPFRARRAKGSDAADRPWI